MRNYLSIIIAVVVVASVAYVTLGTPKQTTTEQPTVQKTEADIGSFTRQRSCARLPHFLKQKGISQPVLIDLSQEHYKGVALLYGQHLRQALHPKAWERFEHFGTYALDGSGNIYLAPMPYISILPTTFSLQTNIYKLDTQTGALSIWMHFDDVKPSASNPYGIISLVYDCDDKTLWVSAIDQSDYTSQKGRIYHIDTKTKRIIDTYEGFDALTLSLLRTSKGKFLLAGSARDSGVHAFAITSKGLQPPSKLFTLPDDKMHVRKIKVKANNTLQLQAIPFSYTLIVETGRQNRTFYQAHKHTNDAAWDVVKVTQ